VTVKDSSIRGDVNLGEGLQEGSNFELKLIASNLVGDVTINQFHGLGNFENQIEDMVEKVVNKASIQQSQSMYNQLINMQNAIKMNPNVGNKFLSLHKIATILEKSGYIQEGKEVRMDLARMKTKTDSPALQIEGHQQLCVYDPSYDWFDSLRTALVLVNTHNLHKYEFDVKSQILHYISEGRSSNNPAEISSFAKTLVLEASNLSRKVLNESPSARRFYKSATVLGYNKIVNLSKVDQKKLLDYEYYKSRRKSRQEDLKEFLKGLGLLIAIWGTIIILVLLFLNWLGSVVLGFLGSIF
tara:strand:- start:44 stop:940 length:897 start_codon:yes stop_codon:yes gene_type:complete